MARLSSTHILRSGTLGDGIPQTSGVADSIVFAIKVFGLLHRGRPVDLRGSKGPSVQVVHSGKTLLCKVHYLRIADLDGERSLGLVEPAWPLWPVVRVQVDGVRRETKGTFMPLPRFSKEIRADHGLDGGTKQMCPMTPEHGCCWLKRDATAGEAFGVSLCSEISRILSLSLVTEGGDF